MSFFYCMHVRGSLSLVSSFSLLSDLVCVAIVVVGDFALVSSIFFNDSSTLEFSCILN